VSVTKGYIIKIFSRHLHRATAVKGGHIIEVFIWAVNDKKKTTQLQYYYFESPIKQIIKKIE